MAIPKLQQIKYISHFLKPKEKFIIKTFWSIILFSFIFLALRFYFVHLQLLPAKGGEYTEGLVGSPKFVNPVLASANEVDLDISQLIFSGLMRYDENQKLIPDLATDYQLSADQKTYTFSLKKNIKWHDGESLNADDIVFTIETIQNPEYKSPLYSSFKGVKCEKIDENQVRFILNEPYSPFPSLLTVGILPKHIWQDIGPSQFHLAEYNLKPIGTGPYQFKSLIKDKKGTIKSYVLKRNDIFYRTPAFLDKFTFKFYNDYNEALDAFRNKLINGVGVVEGILEEINLKNFNRHLLVLPQYTAIFFNQSNNPFLKEKKVRQALSYAIDREKIIKEVLGNNGSIINGPILEGNTGFNQGIKKYQLDLNKANQLLDEAGWKLETSTTTQSSIRKNGKDEFKIILTTLDKEENKKTAEAIKEDWAKLGISTDLQFIPSQIVIKDVIKPKNYQALLYGVMVGPEADPYLLWHSSQASESGLNLSNFSNKTVDQDLEDARKTSDIKIKELKYQDFQNIISEEVPAIFLYSPFYNYLMDNKIKGFNLKNISLPPERFNTIEGWYIKTRRGLK